MVDRAKLEGLPIPAVMAAFDRGVTPAAIAEGFGTDAPLIVEVITDELSKSGLTAEQIAERFGRVWFGMPDRTIIVTGPFTDAELADVVAVLKQIEARRPDETFRLIIDDSSNATTQDALRRLREINPLSAGYQRIIEVQEDR